MYPFLLSLHNIARWILVIAAITLLVKTILAWIDKAPWPALLDKAMRWYTITLDIQLLIGLVLAFAYSPMTLPVFQNLDLAVRNPMMRFFTLTHPLLMIFALVLAHVGRKKTRQANPDNKKYQQILLWFGLSFVLLFLATPWPFKDISRPLIRLLDLAW